MIPLLPWAQGAAALPIYTFLLSSLSTIWMPRGSRLVHLSVRDGTGRDGLTGWVSGIYNEWEDFARPIYGWGLLFLMFFACFAWLRTN